MASGKWAIAIHGGAGVIERDRLKPEQERAYREALAQVVEAGSRVLDRDGSALDAVEAAIHVLEDDPLFNAGRGAVFTAGGRNEHDASIMDGATLQAGSVAGITRVRHPISLARAVMERSPHVMLVGRGDFAPAEWDAAVGLAQGTPASGDVEYLAEKVALADYLNKGLFALNCL